MRCSIELWFHFALNCFRELIRGTSPLRIFRDDILSRELYSGHVTPGGKLNVTAFTASPKNGFGLSVNRCDKAPHRLFVELGLASAQRRSTPDRKASFKGFAHLAAGDLLKIDSKEFTLVAKAELTRTNPFHANIAVPQDKDKSFYLLVASEILDRVQPVTCLHKP